MSKNNTTGYKGVYLMKNGKYRAGIGFNGKNIHLGVYVTKEEVYDARLVGENKYFDPIFKKYQDRL